MQIFHFQNHEIVFSKNAYSDHEIIFLPIERNWFDHYKYFFLFEIYFLILDVFLQHCGNVENDNISQYWYNVLWMLVLWVSPQYSHSIQTMLSQFCGNIENYVIYQHCHNAVTTMPECCTFVFQCWAPTVPQHCLIVSLNIV